MKYIYYQPDCLFNTEVTNSSRISHDLPCGVLRFLQIDPRLHLVREPKSPPTAELLRETLCRLRKLRFELTNWEDNSRIPVSSRRCISASSVLCRVRYARSSLMQTRVPGREREGGAAVPPRVQESSPDARGAARTSDVPYPPTCLPTSSLTCLPVCMHNICIHV